MTGTIAFQGVPGRLFRPRLPRRLSRHDHAALRHFETAIEAVREGECDLAMMPCENTLAGRVPDIHHLLPGSGLFMIGEQFQPVEHCLLA